MPSLFSTSSNLLFNSPVFCCNRLQYSFWCFLQQNFCQNRIGLNSAPQSLHFLFSNISVMISNYFCIRCITYISRGKKYHHPSRINLRIRYSVLEWGFTFLCKNCQIVFGFLSTFLATSSIVRSLSAMKILSCSINSIIL